MVRIARGHDEDKNALRSVLLYDVADDKWVPLPEMAKECDEYKLILQHGWLYIIRGYSNETQGCFKRSGKAIDPNHVAMEPDDRGLP